MRRFWLFLVITMITFGSPLAAMAAIPQLITYQGNLIDGDGAPLNKSVTLQLSLYDVSVGGTSLWTEQQVVVVTNGQFSVNLAAVTPFNLPFDVPYYLGIQVDADQEMSPRQQFTSYPYAIRSSTADGIADGVVGTAAIADGAVTAAKLGITCTTGQVLMNSATGWGCGTVSSSSGTGTITGIIAGNGIVIGGTSATPQIDIHFGGNGAASSAARSDHNHDDIYQKKYIETPDSLIRTIQIPDSAFIDSLIIGDGGKFLTSSAPNPLEFPGNSGDFNGQSNTFIGIGAGRANTSGNINTFIGSMAGRDNTIGDQNTFIGMNAGMSNTTGAHSTYIGAGPGQDNTTGTRNTFVGTDTGLHNTTGSFNSFFGTDSGVLNHTGSANAFFGQQAGANNDADYNSFFGQSAGWSNTTGHGNAFYGQYSGTYNISGNDNAFFGRVSGFANSTGSANTFIGRAAGFSSTIGDNNVGVGKSVLGSMTTGFNNSAVGTAAGAALVTGDSNTFLGVGAGNDPNQKTDAVNSMALGSGTYTTADNQVVIGNTSVTQTLLRSNVGINTNNPSGMLDIRGAGTTTGITLQTTDSAGAARFTVLDSGTVTATGAITGSNLSGTNTGDQNLSGLVIKAGSLTQLTTRSHSDLQNLSADDHTQYPLTAGRVGGQTLVGGNGVTDILKLQGTSGNGTLTSPAIQAMVGNNGATTALTLLNNGNVGIGTTSPLSLLHLYSGTDATARNIIFDTSDTQQDIGENLGGIQFRSNDASPGGAYTAAGVRGKILAISEGIIGETGLGLFTAGYGGGGQNIDATTERMRISNGGNVGIGTQAPNGRLDIKGVGTTTGITLQTTDSTGAAKFTVLDNGTATLDGTLAVTQYKLSKLNTAPSSPSDTGTLGEIRVTATAIYVCIATNTWVKASLATW